MWQRWRAFGNAVSNLTGSRFETQTSRSRDERVTARPTGWFHMHFRSKKMFNYTKLCVHFVLVTFDPLSKGFVVCVTAFLVAAAFLQAGLTIELIENNH